MVGTWTEWERETIERAAAEWNAVLLDPIRITDDGAGTIERAHLPFAWGGNYSGHGRIYIDDELPRWQLHGVALHELGHLIGLAHGPRGIMTETLSADALTADDLAQCIRIGACRSSQ